MALHGLLFYRLAESRRLERFIHRHGLTRRMARRFVAGETIEDALNATHRLASHGLLASLDFLGEEVHDQEEARHAARVYRAIAESLGEHRPQATVSLKLSQLGLAIDEALPTELLSETLQQAAAHGSDVEIDMESSRYTERTLQAFLRVQPRYPRTRLCVQAYLHRTERDLKDLLRLGARVRLCKGAYLESSSVAFTEKEEVDANYLRLAEMLLLEGNYPALATHDQEIIGQLKRFARRHAIAPSRFEFQMLYGVRRNLQLALAREGYRVRVYVPFGNAWYPYLMRRLAERPANLAFLIGNVVEEMAA